MRLSIIPDDHMVVIDGVERRVVFNFPEFHAIQWQDTSGHLEVIGALNTPFNSLDEINQIVDLTAVKSAWDAAAPPPPPEPTPYVPTEDDLRRAAYGAATDVEALKALIKASTPAEIDSWVAANLTSLSHARAIVASLIKLFGAVI